MVPKSLMIDIYFPEERDAIRRLESERDEVLQQMEEMRNEHGGEDGLLSEVIVKDKIAAKRLKERIKETQNKPDDAEELALLRQYEKMQGNESTYNMAIRNAQAALEQAVLDQYSSLSIDEIQELVIDKKWCDTLFDRVDTLFSMLSHHLAERITVLSERYAKTLPELEAKVDEYEKKVKSHLERMGFKW